MQRSPPRLGRLALALLPALWAGQAWAESNITRYVPYRSGSWLWISVAAILALLVLSRVGGQASDRRA